MRDSAGSATRLAAYYRVSSAGQLDGYGISQQRTDCHQWAKRNGYRIIAEHEDSVTGAMDGPERDGFTAALLAIRVDRSRWAAGKMTDRLADGLVIGRLDRLARALTVQEAALALAWREGARVFAADQGEILQDDPDDPMRTAIRQMQGVFAELDRRTTVKRLRDGIRRKKAEGRHATGVYPYGWRAERTGRQVDAGHDPVEWLGVQRILQLRATGTSYRVIAELLDAEGVRPRSATTWSAMAVRNIFERETARPS